MMTSLDRMAERQILEFESRQRHVDEVLEHVCGRTVKGACPLDARARLEELEKEQDRLTVRLDKLRLKSLDNWQVEEIEKSGLMGLWDALAQQAEKLAERLEK
jgi:hypothetical protein